MYFKVRWKIVVRKSNFGKIRISKDDEHAMLIRRKEKVTKIL